MTDIKMPRTGTKIPLSQPIPLSNKSIGEILVVEPSGALYTKLGEPRVLIYNASGGAYYVEQAPVIEAYLAALVRVPEDPSLVDAVLALASLQDMMAAKAALFDFFDQAARALLARRPTS